MDTIAVHRPVTLNDQLTPIRNFQGGDLHERLIEAVNTNRATVEFDEIGLDADGTLNQWDGTIYITYKGRAPKWDWALNLIGSSRPDEIHTEGKTLRLWWD